MPTSWGKITRRSFLAGTVATSLYAWRFEPHWYEVVERELPIARLPPALVGKRLVQINDLHVGERVDSSYLMSALQTVGRMEPDFIALVGDFMTAHGSEQIDEVARVLEALPSSKLGTVAVLGNHDYTLSWADRATADGLSRRLSDAGVMVLQNERRDVAGLQLFGIDEVWGPRFDLERAMQTYDAALPGLVLCHNPDVVDRDGWNNYRGWILAGHTHGGQCRLPFCRPPVVPVGNKNLIAGPYELEHGRKVYVNRGLGHHLRVRFLVRPEITLFTLSEAV